MRFRQLGACLVVIFLLSPAWGAEPFRFPEARHGKGELKYRSGIPVLTVEGTPEEIGEQSAMLVGKPSERLLKFPQEALAHLATPVGAKLLLPGVIKTGYRLLDNFPPEYRREFEAKVKASGFDRELLMLANTAFDQKHLLGALFGCSAVVVEKERSKTGQPIFGRNMDYLSLGYVHEYSLVTVYKQPGKRTFAAVGYPGLIGIVSGMNDAGLAVAALETTGANKDEGPAFNPEGVPFALIYRRILEESTTVDEAAKLLASIKRTTTNNLTVCDRNGGAVFEFTPSRVIVRRAVSGTCRCTNHFISPELQLKVPKNIHTTLDRLAMLEKCCGGSGRIGLDEVKKYLHAVNQADETLQSMIFEPVTLTLYLAVAVGKEPSSGQPYKRLELGPLLSGGRAER
jgi:isopenicillin-N N-acyltransferase like protein